MKTICAWKNNRFSLLFLKMLFFVIHVFHVMPLNAMRTGERILYKGPYRQTKIILDKMENAQSKRNLLIFLDDSEKEEFGGVCGELVAALYQEAAIIIASSSLICTLIEHAKKDRRPIETILNERPSNWSRIPWSKSKLLQENIATCKIGFQPEKWIIKEINQSLLLLIPKSYCQLLKIDTEKVKEYNNIASDVELQLGFKVNHIKTIEYTKIRRAALKEYFFPHYFADYFVNSLDNIFCEKSEYRMRSSIRTEWNEYNDATTISMPEWVIYIDGHGGINRSIAHLSLEQFKKFLFFLENKIRTQLLVVQSCYAAGTNVNKVYGDIKLGTQEYYSFPIIIKGLNDLRAVGYAPKVDMEKWDERAQVSLSVPKNFVDFFKRADEKKGKYGEIIEPILSIYRDPESEPQIKMPGIEWFSVIDIDDQIVSIGSILAKTRDPGRPLDIASWIKKKDKETGLPKKPKIILLYTDNIPFELVINPELKAIISMVPAGLTASAANPMINRIKKLSAKNYNIYNICLLFKSVIDTNGAKWFFIDEIKNSNKIFKDVLIAGTVKEGMSVYYKDEDDVLQKLNYNQYGQEIMTGPNFLDEYQYEKSVNMIRAEYPKQTEKISIEKREITPEQIQKIKEVLIKQREKQKALTKGK